jgi:ATP-dependent Lhr-like helicase
VVARDLIEPSPLAAEILTARPYAYLDDAPLEERRTLAVSQRRWLDPGKRRGHRQARSRGHRRVANRRGRKSRTPTSCTMRMHAMGVITEQEGASGGLDRAISTNSSSRGAPPRLHTGSRASSGCAPNVCRWSRPSIPRAARSARRAARREARRRSGSARQPITDLVRGRLQSVGPITARDMARRWPSALRINIALIELESEGFVLRGRFTTKPARPRPCSRGRHARVVRTPPAGAHPSLHHQDAARGDRARVGRGLHAFPVRLAGRHAPAQTRGVESSPRVITQLEGFEIPAAAWESDVLRRASTNTTRTGSTACVSRARVVGAAHAAQVRRAAPVRTTPIALVTRKNWSLWHRSRPRRAKKCSSRTAPARCSTIFSEHGASFFDDLVSGTKLLRSQAETALGELVSAGLVNADSYSGLRALLIPSDKRRQLVARRRRVALFGSKTPGAGA